MKVQVAANHVENFLLTRHADELTMEAFKTLKAYVKGAETKRVNAAPMTPPAQQRPANTVQTDDGQNIKLWTPEEETTLRAEFASKLDAATIARLHERTIGGIAARLVKLGCIKHRSELPGFDEYEAAMKSNRAALPKK